MGLSESERNLSMKVRNRKSPREQQLHKGANVNQIPIDCNIKKPEVQGRTGLSSIRRKP